MFLKYLTLTQKPTAAADLDLVDKALPVAAAEQPADKSFGLKALKLVHVLAGADEGDGRLRGSYRAQRAAALGMAVHLCDDHSTHLSDVHAVV